MRNDLDNMKNTCATGVEIYDVWHTLSGEWGLFWTGPVKAKSIADAWTFAKAKYGKEMVFKITDRIPHK